VHNVQCSYLQYSKKAVLHMSIFALLSFFSLSYKRELLSIESTIFGTFGICMSSLRRFIGERAAKKHRLPVRIGSNPPPPPFNTRKALNPTQRNEREMKGGSIVALLAEGGASSFTYAFSMIKSQENINKKCL
jgi:hypothetical protein